MNDETTTDDSVAVFAVSSEMDYFVPGDTVENEGIQWLLDNLPVAEDEEYGIEEVEVAVKATRDGVLYDVLLNAMSVGHFCLRAYIASMDSLKYPELLALGKQSELDLQALADDADYAIYIVPLFGELSDVGA